MNYRPLLVFIFSVFVNNILFGQTLKEQIGIDKGEEFKIKSRRLHSDIFPDKDGGLYAFEPISKTKVDVVQFDANLKKQAENEINFKLEGGLHDYEGAFYLNETLYLLTSKENNQSKLNQLYIRTINTKTLQLNNDERVVSSIDYEGNWKTNSGTFSIRISNDSSKLGIFNISPSRQKKLINYSMTILDVNNDLAVLWSKSFSSKNIDWLSDLQNARISNAGEAMFLFKNYKNKRRERVNGDPNYDYEVQYVDENGENEFRYAIQLKSDFVSNMQIGFNNNNEIIATGFYSTEGRGEINGSYYLLIDKSDKSVKKESKKEFGIDFITDFMKEGQAKRAQKRKAKGKDEGFLNYTLDEIVFRSDGGVIQIAEQYFVTVQTITDANGNTTTVTKYHYNTIIVVSISPEGEIEWARKIPKQQVSSGIAYSSYSFNVVNNKMYFFYIDNPKNLLAENYGDMKAWIIKKSVVVAIEIDPEGFMNKAGLLDSKEDKTVLMPTSMVMTKSGQLVGFAKWDKKGRYYRFKMKE